MRALLYLRKSTDEHQADSIDTQRENATRFVVEKLGGAVVAEILDEGESRAEFKTRAGFSRLLAQAASKTRDFDTLVVRDESRLGAGERLVVALDDIIAAGVAVYYYSTGEMVRLDSAESRLVHSVKAIFADAERAKTAGRTREALELKARAGLNVGGRCYGYDNVRTVDTATGKASTSYVINPDQAQVIVAIAEQYAAGLSERAIAHSLNERGVPSPAVGRRGTRSWSPSAIRFMLRRPRYFGRLEWGRIGAAYKGGTRVTFQRGEAEVTAFDAPHLRIIPVELEQRIAARIARAKEASGDPAQVRNGRTRYLLSGKQIARCGTCGGPIQVMHFRSGPRKIAAYGCAWHKDRGNSVCTNATRRPVADVDEAVLAHVRGVALAEGIFDAVLAEVKKNLQAPNPEPEAVDILTAEAAKLEKEISRIARTVALSDDAPEALAQELDKRSKRLREVRGILAARAAAPAAMARELERVQDAVKRHLEQLRTSLEASTADERRAVIMALFKQPLTMTPTEGGRFEVAGVSHPGNLFRTVSDPTGT